MYGRNLGRFLFPRLGSGVRYGESVSIIMRSMGVILNASLRESALLNVTIPEKDRYAPLSNANSAS